MLIKWRVFWSLLVLRLLVVWLIILRVTNLCILTFDFNFWFAGELHHTLSENLPDFVPYRVFGLLYTNLRLFQVNSLGLVKIHNARLRTDHLIVSLDVYTAHLLLYLCKLSLLLFKETIPRVKFCFGDFCNFFIVSGRLNDLRCKSSGGWIL